MRMPEYIKDKPRGEKARLARVSGLAYGTVHNVCNGELLKTYDAAEKLSAATGGVVSIDELCKPPAGDAASEHRAAGAA